MNTFFDLLRGRLLLDDDKANEAEIVDSIRKSIEFKGTNLWALILAILIASIGLNVNSTAVIIGAMLISPLMGPIMGIGLGIGVNDFPLIKKAFTNLGLAALFSVLTSSLYFLISPLNGAHSELLARTTPTLWDVLIAFSGGLVGIIAGSRKDKGTYVAGVAIATALMPPLCTAGYGLAKGQWMYFVGAVYLFFINGVSISLATFLLVRFLGFRKVTAPDAKTERRVRWWMLAIVLATVVPSAFVGFLIVQRSGWEQDSQTFLASAGFETSGRVVLSSRLTGTSPPRLEVVLLGQGLSEEEKADLDRKKLSFGLKGIPIDWVEADKNRASSVPGSLYRSAQVEIDALKQKLDDLQKAADQVAAEQTLETQVSNELESLAHGWKIVSIHRQTIPKDPTLTVVYSGTPLRSAQMATVTAWLATRTGVPNILFARAGQVRTIGAETP